MGNGTASPLLLHDFGTTEQIMAGERPGERSRVAVRERPRGRGDHRRARLSDVHDVQVIERMKDDVQVMVGAHSLVIQAATLGL